MKKRYEVNKLVEISPQNYECVAIYKTNSLEVAESVAFEQCGHVEDTHYIMSYLKGVEKERK